jgi:hypothetical protein
MSRREGEPHVPIERLQHFLETVDECEQFSAVFPLPLKLVFGQPERNRWTVIAHAMMLRKYFSGHPAKLTSGDALSLNAIIRALRESISDPSISSQDWDWMEMNAKVLQSTTRYLIQGEDRPEQQIMEDELYSRYLHGEANKRRRRIGSQVFADEALWKMTHNRASRTNSVAALVRQKIDGGLLNLDQ